MKLLPLILILMFTVSHFSQQPPPIQAGVPQALAQWRAWRYKDVRYKLNLTLEKMSSVLKGTIEIRVDVSVLPRGTHFGMGLRTEEQKKADLSRATGPDGEMPAIILDWRKIRGSESLSTISNVSINGIASVLSPGSRRPSAEQGPPEGETQNSYEESIEHLIFRQGVKAGENVIKLDFTSPILASGSAVTRYVDKEDGSEYLYSLFVPSDASMAFPVFDQPDLKARFNVKILAPDDWKVISNTPATNIHQTEDYKEVSKTPSKDGGITLTLEKTWVRIWSFPETKPISTYVFAFAAGPWVEFENNKQTSAIGSESGYRPTSGGSPTLNGQGINGPQTHIYVRKSQAEKFTAHEAEVFRLNREGVKFLEEYFDYKFPFPKYDIVLIPEFPFGGMEHAGATFLRESSIIFPSEPTANDFISRANVIFHEAAHQWFGDTVTMRWFDDLWLKEGFAEFMAYKTLERVMPQYNAWKAFYERNKPAAYATDSTRGTTPIYQEIPNLSAAKSAYGNIVYRKAPSFLRQAEFYLGPDKFQTAVRAFLKKHEYANAGWEDLVKEFEAASGQDLKGWGESWVKQRGLPIFRASLDDNGEVEKYSIQQLNALGDDAYWKMRVKVFDAIKDPSSFESFERNRDSQKELGKGTTEVRERIYCRHVCEPTKFVFPNYEDFGYGIFLLDPRSRKYVLENIGLEPDDFLRSMMWGTLWDSVREGELDPREYVELAIKNIGVEKDELTIQTILGRVSTAMTYYIPSGGSGGSVPPAVAGGAVAPSAGNNANDLNARLENLLIEKMRTAPTVGQKVTYYRAFLNIASTENARRVLKGMLAKSAANGQKTPPATAGGTDTAAAAPQTSGGSPTLNGGGFDIPLKTKDRFDIVTKLAILGDPDAPALLAELEKTETSDDAKRYAYAAHAAFPTKENREKFWNDFVNNNDISESWIEAAMGPFNSPRHSELSMPYLQRALAELPNLKRNRKIFFVNGWLGAFIGGQKSQEALDIVNKFLADNPGLDRDLRLKILENADVVERAVKIRKRFESRL